MVESGSEWTSPDDKIFKILLTPGVWGQKPYDGSIVKLKITADHVMFNKFDNRELMVGNSDGELGRLIDICICTMHLNEIAAFTITLDLEQYTVNMQLISLDFKGYVYEWSAKEKMQKALELKRNGCIFFEQSNYTEAVYKFSKALKLVLSIPIDAECVPDTVDDVAVTDITEMKENLYNNMAACYFKARIYKMVIPLCDKVLNFNPNNVKALYKIGIAYEHCRDFEEANESFSKLAELEPEKEAWEHHLHYVRKQLKEANIKVDNMFKKMVIDTIGK